MVIPFTRTASYRCERVFPALGQVAGLVVIDYSVGANGRNLPDDSKAIQDALNRIPPEQGGASPKLDVDGLPWAKTIAAIRHFQEFQALPVADGRVDPDWPTIKRLNALLAPSSTLGLGTPGGIVVGPETIAKVYRMLPEVLQFVRAADAKLLLAWTEQLSGPTPIGTGGTLASVNRHFSFDKNPNWQMDFPFVRSIFRDMEALLRRNIGGFEQTFQAGPGAGSSATDLVVGRNAVAVSFSGGRDMQGTTIKGRDKDGKRVVMDGGKIYILPAFQFNTGEGQVMTLIHEMSHYLGDEDGKPNQIDDYGYGWIDRLDALSPRLKARNAQCYGNFASEAKLGREPFVIPA
jgi:Putative peptidoglycan binding domain